MSVQTVRIDNSALARDTGGLLSVLERLFPVEFRVGDQGGGDVLCGRISCTVAPAVSSGLPVGGPTLVVPPAKQGSDDDEIVSTSIRFADDRAVPWPYRGRSIAVRIELAASVHKALGSVGDRILATDAEGRPIWSLAGSAAGLTHATALRLPHMLLGEDVGLAAAGERFIQVLPLFHFIAEMTNRQRLLNPPLRAAFIIDDPNLHWPSYGFADYRAIAASARRERYHVAFATIPLDGWWIHAKTAEIFRAHSDGLSLLIHGNNHARQELAQCYSREAMAGLLQEAVSRIRQLEAKSGLAVSRVMVPPHGACSARILAEMPRYHFESACISAGSLRAHNTGQAWTNTLGLAPSEVVEGCPVLPRWAFGSASDATLLAAAYLGQPLILRGHHHDLKNGLDVLRGLASTINTLGDVRWGSLSELSRLNYRHRIEGSRMHVQPLGMRVDVDVPKGIDEIQIETGGLDWRALPQQSVLHCTTDGSVRASVVAGCTYAFAHHPQPVSVTRPKTTTSAKLILRRVFTEARDRLRFT